MGREIKRQEGEREYGLERSRDRRERDSMGRETERPKGERQCGQRDRQTDPGGRETVCVERSRDRRERQCA